MTKKQLIEAIQDQCARSLTRVEINAVLDAQAQIIQQELARNSGESVVLHGIGKIKSVYGLARMGRNPANGEAISIPEKWRIKFTASKHLTDAINER